MRHLVDFSVEFSGGKAVAFETDKHIIIILDGGIYAIEKSGDWDSECCKVERTLVGACESFPSLGITRLIRRYDSNSGLSGEWLLFFDAQVDPRRIDAIRVDASLFDRVVSPLAFPVVFYDRKKELFQYCKLSDDEIERLPKCRAVFRSPASPLVLEIDTLGLLWACDSLVRVGYGDPLAVEIYPGIWKLPRDIIVEANDEEIIEYLENK